jgi:hypothetical protein
MCLYKHLEPLLLQPVFHVLAKGSPAPVPAAGASTPGAAVRQVILAVYMASVIAIVIAIACLIFLFT